eukprot:13803105-Ditylum_brightwellii.AAC.1
MDTLIDPNQPIMFIFKQLVDGKKFVTAAGVPYTRKSIRYGEWCAFFVKEAVATDTSLNQWDLETWH